jgi:hypothetical protein
MRKTIPTEVFGCTIESGQEAKSEILGTISVTGDPMRKLMLLCLVGAGVVCAQQPVSTAKETDLCKLEGRVVNSVTSEPVNRVTLTLRMSGAAPVSMTATTDASGKFAFEGLAPGSYTLTAEKVGFIRQGYGARTSASLGTTLALVAGQALKDLEFKLIPQGIIAGKVVDDEGEPIPRVFVTAVRLSGYGSRVRQPSALTSSTNDVGEFRIANLLPGRYLIKVAVAQPMAGLLGGMLASMGRSAEKPGQAKLTTFYPNAADDASAAPVIVGPGQQVTGIIIPMRKGDVYQVQGSVLLAASNWAMSGISVRLLPRDTGMDSVSATVSGMGSGNVKPDGSFVLVGVEPGAYDLIATPVNGQLEALGRIPVDVGSANVKDVVLTVGERLQFAGTVRVEEQEKADLKAVRVTLKPEGLQLNNPSAAPAADGSLKFEAVPRAKYAFSFSGLPEGTYVKSIRSGGQDVLNLGLDLTQAESSGSVEVVLSPSAAVVEGVVKDGDNPSPLQYVSLVPDPLRPERSDLLRTVVSDQSGRFSVKGVAPGSYRIYALEESLPSSVFTDPRFWAQFGSKSTRVKLGQSDRTQVDAPLIKAEGGQGK